MRIDHLFVENFQGLKSASLDLKGPITLVAGANGAGKSSLKEAIGLALGGTARVKLKGDYKMMITEGQKKAQVIITHDDGASSFALPKGTVERTPTIGDEYLPYVLNPAMFAALDEKACRSMLFKLTKSSAKPEVVIQKLRERGADAAKVEKIKPMLLSGFAGAQEMAKTYTSESRGAWKATTGEAYGSDKAECWAVIIDDLPEGVDEASADSLEHAQAELANAQAEIEKGTRYLGELSAKRDAANGMATRKSELESAFAQLERATNKRAVTEKDLADWVVKIGEAETKLAAHSDEGPSCDCPSCGVKLKIVGKIVEVFMGKTADLNKKAAYGLELKKAREAHALLLRTKANDDKAVLAAEQAGRDLEALNSTTGEVVDDAMVTRVENAIQVQRNLRDKHTAAVKALGERLELIKNAQKRADAAAQHHTDVQEWTLIEKALAPDGIPAEILAGALKPFNASLAKSSALSGWPKVQIGTDMAITAAGRLYTLLSESEKWRCDSLLALAIAEHSGLRLVALDRYDVLDLPARGQLMGMLMALAKSGVIETALVFGTLKARPAKLPDQINGVWIEGGIASGDQELQQAS